MIVQRREEVRDETTETLVRGEYCGYSFKRQIWFPSGSRRTAQDLVSTQSQKSVHSFVNICDLDTKKRQLTLVCICRGSSFCSASL